MKVGILGGTFDPIHLVHLLSAEQAREQMGLDEVWFMPARIPPHKDGSGVSDARQRLKMVELAIENISHFHAVDFELERSGPSYTFDTITLLRDRFPKHEFYFIIGGDMIDYLPHWHRIQELVQCVQFVGVHRPGYCPDNEFAKKHVRMVEMPLMDLSSTFIRERRKEGQSIRFMVSDKVREYIEENRLYESR